MYCPSCGNYIADNAVFCGYCGAQARSTAAAVQSAPPAFLGLGQQLKDHGQAGGARAGALGRAWP